ncbi:TetR/AcrR family transcriptional regulator [Rhodococcus opacus]|uniref:TetR/AcrR family transcriptional regulator n=1 Tax=Rhodococcus opacus TaxID=37919 RepID=UPI001C47908B|nr:TetR/AcrR family transcriptional regulator [Rhodococcus opacus]MBV6762298.1 TetR/AcrR family transcriptional regulator [Rhodococcus opacus]
MVDGKKPRQRRANGDASRLRILDAAMEVAAERGYDGTTIALVSRKCGLPASSIYWHFTDKDVLVAAVIERSFTTWLSAWSIPRGDSARERIREMLTQIAKALLDSPDFLRLGLMLALERRPSEPRARTMFLEVREEARRRIDEAFRELAPGIEDRAVKVLTTYAMAGADGLFIAKEIDGDGFDLLELFDLHANLLLDAARRLNG